MTCYSSNRYTYNNYVILAYDVGLKATLNFEVSDLNRRILLWNYEKEKA
jgi:hypothetical protein